MKVFCYKMTCDTGFAPNPFYGVLTLATCKPNIRRVAKPGDWIAGFTGKPLNPKQKVGEEKLVYLAKITGKLTFAEYWQLFPEKRPIEQSVASEPSSCSGATVSNPKKTTKPCCGSATVSDEDNDCYRKCGDNIYEPCESADKGYRQRAGKNHQGWTESDLKADAVLVCEEFYYFPEGKYVDIPSEIHPSLPRDFCYSRCSEELVEYIKAHCVTSETLTASFPIPFKCKSLK